MSVLDEMLKIVIAKTDPNVLLLTLLIFSIIYIWFQHHRFMLLKFKVDLEKERKNNFIDENINKRELVFNLHRTKITERPLIIEDEVTIRQLLYAILKKFDRECVVDYAEDGESAIKKIHENQPSIIFLDVVLPIKSGIDVLLEIQKSGYRIPIVITSSYADFDTLNKYGIVLNDQIAFLPKPFSSREMIAVISGFKIESNHIMNYSLIRKIR